MSEATVEIADFGIGADSPILLEYSAGPLDPRVIRLEWRGEVVQTTGLSWRMTSLISSRCSECGRGGHATNKAMQRTRSAGAADLGR